MPTKKRRNPFYALLVPTGVAFVVTACAYGFMAFQVVNATRENATLHGAHPLFQWLREHGEMAMLVELAVLAVLTVGAMATEDRWNPPTAISRHGEGANDSDQVEESQSA